MDEESGKQEQPVTTEETATTPPAAVADKEQQPQPSDNVIVVDVTKPSTDKPNLNKNETTETKSVRMNRRMNRATLFFLGLVLVGLLVTAITVPIVKSHQKSSSANASGVSSSSSSAQGGETGGGNDEPFVLTIPAAGNASSSLAAGSFEPLWPGVSDAIGFYDKTVIQGYADTADLQADLEIVAKMMVNQVVARSTGTTSFGDKYNYGGGSSGGATAPPAMENSAARAPMDDMAEERESEADGGSMGDAMPVMAPTSMASVGNNVNDFGSNNQEDSVEEGDKIVSDGTRVFASYGDYIIAWDVATGQQLAIERMEKFGEQVNNANTTTPTSDTSIPVEGETTADRMYMPIYYEPIPTIMSLLLVDDKLIVAVDGGYQTGPVERILSSYGQTRVLVYDTTNVGVTAMGNMTRLSSRDYNGNFIAFRAIGENLHTVTSAQVNTYTALVGPAERYSYETYDATTGQPTLLTDAEYMGRVKADAESKFIPNFVDKLTKELTLPDGSLPKLARISKFLTHTSDVNPQMDQYFLYDSGLLNSITLVHSMNIEQPAADSSSSAGVFLPSYSASVYSSENFMIIAGQGYDYSPMRLASTESTYLTAMKLNGASSTPYSIGTVEGSFLNPRSFDVFDNVLRVATTIQNFWRWDVFPMPMEGDMMMPLMESDVMAVETATSDTTSTPSTGDGDVAAASEPLVLETDESAGVKPTLVFVDIPEPDNITTTITTEPLPIIDDTQSTTENYIITLKLPDEDDENHGMMQELDRIQLGKPQETFTSVRFFDNVAYAVTFQRRDPFYVLNVTDPSDLQVLAEVNITGFSSYLHSMNDENTMILAIGQEADEFGTVLGLQISLFDARDVNDVKVLRHTVETDPNVYSDTAGMWDFMAIRFNRETGRLIIPVDMSNWQNPSQDFHGFRVYSVTETAVEEDENCRVQMGNANQMSSMCFYCASLEPRAMIMNGNMMLTKGHFVKSIDMDDCSTQWEFAVNSTRDPTTECCGYYY